MWLWHGRYNTKLFDSPLCVGFWRGSLSKFTTSFIKMKYSKYFLSPKLLWKLNVSTYDIGNNAEQSILLYLWWGVRNIGWIRLVEK